MRDAPTVFALHGIKLVRVAAVWLALFVAERVYLDLYVQRTLVRGGAPPPLYGLVLLAVGLEALAALAGGLLLAFAATVYRRLSPALVLDGQLLRLALKDYAWTTAAFLAAALLLARVVQGSRALRYRDDGMRAIRAFSVMLLPVAAVLLSLPMYLL
jgi:hypothetical protein